MDFNNFLSVKNMLEDGLEREYHSILCNRATAR